MQFTRTKKPMKIDAVDNSIAINDQKYQPISNWDGTGKVVRVHTVEDFKKGTTMERTVMPTNPIPERLLLAALEMNKELGLTPPIVVKHTTVDQIKKELRRASKVLDLDDDDVSSQTLEILKELGCKIEAPNVPIPSNQKKVLKLQKVEKLLKERNENEVNIIAFPHMFMKRLYMNWSICLEEWERARVIDDMVYGLAGDSSKRERQDVVSALSGEKVPASKAGIVILKMMIIKWLDELQNSRFDAFKEKQKPKFTRTIPATAAPVQVSKFTRTR